MVPMDRRVVVFPSALPPSLPPSFSNPKPNLNHFLCFASRGPGRPSATGHQGMVPYHAGRGAHKYRVKTAVLNALPSTARAQWQTSTRISLKPRIFWQP